MSVTYGFFNSIDSDRKYNADQMSTYFKGLVSNGVYLNIGGAFKVTASGDGLSVNVATGRGIIEWKWIESNAVENIVLNAADPSKPRYTAITLRLSNSDRNISISFHDGAAAASPSKPTPVRTAEFYELILAYVLVPAGATSISQAQITDTRASSDLCGWVSGLIKQVDTGDLFDQFNTAYQDMLVQMSNWQARQQAQYEEWFSTLSSELSVGAVCVEYNKTETYPANSGTGRNITLDMTGYSYRSDDIIMVYINGLSAIKDTDYEIDISGSQPVITFTQLDVKSNPCTVEVKVLQSKASSGGGGEVREAVGLMVYGNPAYDDDNDEAEYTTSPHFTNIDQ